MNHVKTYQVERYRINDKEFVIEGPMSYDDLKALTFDEHLSSFRDPEDQFEALLEITTLKEGRIYIVRLDQLIVGYVTYHYPDEIERWSTGNLPYLIELGAIEVSINFRQLQLAEKLIQLSLSAPEFEDYIVITTEYYWHWDLKNSKLDVFEYKKIMQRLMATGGLEIFAT
ncbi:N-acetyltransferase, partial [Staphylococcus argenteus]